MGGRKNKNLYNNNDIGCFYNTPYILLKKRRCSRRSNITEALIGYCLQCSQHSKKIWHDINTVNHRHHHSSIGLLLATCKWNDWDLRFEMFSNNLVLMQKCTTSTFMCRNSFIYCNVVELLDLTVLLILKMRRGEETWQDCLNLYVEELGETPLTWSTNHLCWEERPQRLQWFSLLSTPRHRWHQILHNNA